MSIPVGCHGWQDRTELRKNRQEGRSNFIPAQLSQSNFNNVCQCIPVENSRDRIAHIEHQHAQPAVDLVRATAARVSHLTDAPDRRERSVDQANDHAESNFIHSLRQRIATVLPTFAFHVTGRFQLGKDLFQEFYGQSLLRSQLAGLQHGPAQFRSDAQINQCPESVFASF